MALTAGQIREFGKIYEAAWCSRDVSAVVACFEEDGQIVVNGGTPAKGHAEIS